MKTIQIKHGQGVCGGEWISPRGWGTTNGCQCGL